MKFFAHNDIASTPNILVDKSVYSSSNLAFRFEADAYTDPNYTELPNLADWNDYHKDSNYNYKQYRNLLIAQEEINWHTRRN